MYSKKLVYTGFTAPVLIYLNHAANFQKRRRQDKEFETERR